MQNTALSLIDDAEQASAMLHPMRLRILDALRDPGSAATVARALGVPRQKVNYHLRELEKAGFLEEVEQRRNGNCVERIVRARPSHYLIHPEILGSLGTDPATVNDRFSSAYLVALAANAIRDVAAAQQRASSSGRKLATFSLQSDIRFASAAERKAFAEELSNAVARLVAKYHDEKAPHGRTYRLIVGSYPAKKEKSK